MKRIIFCNRIIVVLTDIPSKILDIIISSVWQKFKPSQNCGSQVMKYKTKPNYKLIFFIFLIIFSKAIWDSFFDNMINIRKVCSPKYEMKCGNGCRMSHKVFTLFFFKNVLKDFFHYPAKIFFFLTYTFSGI